MALPASIEDIEIPSAGPSSARWPQPDESIPEDRLSRAQCATSPRANLTRNSASTVESSRREASGLGRDRSRGQRCRSRPEEPTIRMAALMPVGVGHQVSKRNVSRVTRHGNQMEVPNLTDAAVI